MKETDSPKARISVLSYVKNDFIIDSIISPLSIGENGLAYQNIENAAEIIDFKKSIILFSMFYASTELFIQLLEKNSKFIFRLKKDIYNKERKRMKTNDEYVEIKLNSSRTRSIKNEDLKEKAKEMGYLNLRIADRTKNR